MNVKVSPSRVTMHFQIKRISIILFVLLSLIYNGDCKCIYKDGEKPALECTESFDNTQLINLTMKVFTLDIHDALTLPPLTLQPEYFTVNSQLKSMISEIRIHNTTLIKIDKNAFGGLVDLKNLNISDNHMLRIIHPEAISQVPSLNMLDLSGNKKLFNHIKGPILISEVLEKLDLSRCEIEHLPDDAFDQLTELTHLWLNDNKIRKLPASVFSGLKSLKELDLSNNFHSNLPGFMLQNNTEINDFTLYGNSFENNKGLETIRLSGIPSLSLPPKFIGYFPYIHFMDISNSGLVHLMPDVFEKMTSIAKLNLSQNAFTDSESLGRALNPLAYLKILDLSHNKLRVIGEKDFSGNINLNELFLSGNQLLSPPSPSSIQSLTLLDLSYCTLTSINLVDILQKSDLLQQLYLSNNNLSSITDEHLLEISPTVIPASLIVLELYENPWSCDPALLSLIERAKERGIQPSRYGSYGNQNNVQAHEWDSLAKEVCSQHDYDVAITLKPLNLPPAIVGAKTKEFPVWIWYIFGIFLAFAIVCGIILDQFRRHNRYQSKGLLPPQKSMNISLVGATGGMKVSGRSKDYQRLQEDRSPSSPTTPRIYRPPQKGNHFTFPDAQSAQGSEGLEDFCDHEKV